MSGHCLKKMHCSHFTRYVTRNIEFSFHYTIENPRVRGGVNCQKWEIMGENMAGAYFFDDHYHDQMYFLLLTKDLPVFIFNLPINIQAQMWVQDGTPVHLS